MFYVKIFLYEYVLFLPNNTQKIDSLPLCCCIKKRKFKTMLYPTIHALESHSSCSLYKYVCVTLFLILESVKHYKLYEMKELKGRERKREKTTDKLFLFALMLRVYLAISFMLM